MPQFLASAACNGSHPRRVQLIDNQISRPALIARLMRERHVPRFLVAPTGFGKTAIALEYAETVFSFDRVFWIDGTSPCFLRDLDKGILSATLIALEIAPQLVVIEDVPLLDEQRNEMLSRDINALLDHGCEVLLTCAPTCDGFESHRDRVVLTSADLLLSNTELNALCTPAERDRLAAFDVPDAERVAAFVWRRGCRNTGICAMLERDLRDEPSMGLIGSLFVMLSLKQGSLSEVKSFVAVGPDEFAFIEKYYSYVGVCEFDNTFTAIDVDFDDIVSVFDPHLAAVADLNGFDKSQLLCTLADQLLLREAPKRACDLMRAFAPKITRAQWLAQRGEALQDAACLVPAYELFLSLGSDALKLEPSLVVFQYHCLWLLGDREQAFGCAERAARLVPVDPSRKLEALVAMVRCSDGEAHQIALRNLDHLVQTSWAQETDWPFGPTFSKPVMEAVVTIASSDCSFSAKAHFLASLIVEGIPHRLILSLLALLLIDAKASWSLGVAESDQVESCTSLAWVGAALGNCLDTNADRKLTLYEALAVASYEHLNDCALHQNLPWDSGISQRALSVMDSFYTQQAQWSHQRASVLHVPKSTTVSRLVSSDRTAAKSVSLQHAPEKLTVKLFGGLEVYRGNTRIDPRLFSRRNVRILLALLVLNRGREFSRDYLIGQLWPEAEIDAGRRSFYTVWSLLKQALGPTSRECPYLIRQQLGVRLDATLLESDVGELETICHRLLFEGPEYKGWSSIHERVTTTFAEDLMPGVEASPIIESWRREYRGRLTDALTSASNRLRNAGNIQDALWFSQAAYQREPTREDVCITLMRAQIEAGQRSAAIATYHACRRSLADELGIDPSLETMNLYTRIIESEEFLL